MADISKKTILILLILVVLSSIISTWAFVSTISNSPRVKLVSPRTSTSSAEIGLVIKTPGLSKADAEVAMNIVGP